MAMTIRSMQTPPRSLLSKSKQWIVLVDVVLDEALKMVQELYGNTKQGKAAANLLNDLVDLGFVHRCCVRLEGLADEPRPQKKSC
jgi:hypothetical protein